MKNTKMNYLIRKYGGVNNLAAKMETKRHYVTQWTRKHFKRSSKILESALEKLGLSVEWFESKFNQEWRVIALGEEVEPEVLIQLYGFDHELPIEYERTESGLYLYYQVIAK